MVVNRTKFEATLPTSDARVEEIERIIDSSIKANWNRFTKVLSVEMANFTPLDVQQGVKELYRRNGWKITFESSQHYNDSYYSIRIEGC